MTVLLTETLKAVRIHGYCIAHVFLTQEGTPYRDICMAFTTAVKGGRDCGLHSHDLGYTFASRPVMAGMDLTMVKELMGHKHIAMTLR